MQVNRRLDTSSNALHVERARMSLSKAEMKSFYKQVVKELLLEEKAIVEANEQEKKDKYMEIIDALSFQELLDSEVDYEEENGCHFSLKLYNFPDDIQEHLRLKFDDALCNLNAHFKALMVPVISFVDEWRKNLINKELDGYTLNKELIKSMKTKRVKEEVTTI